MSDGVQIDLEVLRRFFATEPDVVCATVFGSAQEGTVRPEGDLDVAVLFAGDPPTGGALLEFYCRLCNAMPAVEAVDLVVLNTANPILSFEAIRGRFVAKNDPDLTAAFFSLVCREYEDVMGNLRHQRRLRREAA